MKNSEKKQQNSVYYKRPRDVVVWMIRLYQKTISPDHGIYKDNPVIGCRYFPSCSEYSARAIHNHGVVKGGVKAMWRILRCNPLSPGGVDESYK